MPSAVGAVAPDDAADAVHRMRLCAQCGALAGHRGRLCTPGSCRYVPLLPPLARGLPLRGVQAPVGAWVRRLAAGTGATDASRVPC